MTRTARRPCNRCKKPAVLVPLYARLQPGLPALSMGAYGPKCFLITAHGIVKQGWVPERQDAKRVAVRGAA